MILHGRFVARFSLRRFNSVEEALGEKAGHMAEGEDGPHVCAGQDDDVTNVLQFECLSPFVVHKEMATLKDVSILVSPRSAVSAHSDGGEGAATGDADDQSSLGEPEAFMDFLRHRQPSIFWSLVLHFVSEGLPLSVLLRHGSVVVRRAGRVDVHHAHPFEHDDGLTAARERLARPRLSPAR